MKTAVIIVLCVLIVCIVGCMAALGATGYYSYKSIAETVKAPERPSDGSIVFMSANIRRKEPFIVFKKEDLGNHRWWKRAEFYLKNIAEVSPDILGVQEAQPEQYEFLKDRLEGYESVIGYRDKKGAKSEACPIFYNASRFTLVNGGIFWLTDTPNVMSKREGSIQYRIATFAKLKENATGLVIAVYNAHPDWTPLDARKEEIKVLAAHAQASDADKVVVLGDLNSDKNTEDGSDSLAALEAFLKDSTTFPGMSNYGITYQGYGLFEGEWLDYIYLPESATVLSVGKVDKIYDGVYPSDHFPIYAKVKF